MGILQDPSAPPAVTNNSSTPGTLTTAAFLPPGASLLVASVAIGRATSGSGVAVTDTSGRIWLPGAVAVGATGNSAIYYTYLTAAPTSPITVSAKSTNGTFGSYLGVQVLTGASPVQYPTGWQAVYTSTGTANGQIAMTTRCAGSLVFGISSDPTSNTTFAALTGTTQIGSTLTQSGDFTIAAWASTAAVSTPGSTTFGGTWGASHLGNVAVFEVIPAGSMYEDPSQPAVVALPGTAASGGSPVNGATCASFSPPSNSMLVALVNGGWFSSSTKLTGATVTDTAGHVWQQVAYAQGTNHSARGLAAVFVAYVPTAPATPISVTAAFTNLTGGRYLAVRVVNGANPTQSAATGFTSTPSGRSTTNPQISMLTTQTGSLVYGAIDNCDSNDPITMISGTTQIGTQYNDAPDTVTLTSFRSTSPTTTPGSATFGGTVSPADVVNVAAFELLPLVPSGGGGIAIPAVPTFVDGLVPTAAQLNALGANINNLFNITGGGRRYAPYQPDGKGPTKALTVLQVSNPNFQVAGSGSSGSLIIWDTVLANTDAGWSPLDAGLIEIVTPGLWRLHFQCNLVALASGSQTIIVMLINGTSQTTSGVAYAITNGGAAGCSATLELAAGSQIYCAALQDSGVLANVGLMQFAAEWLGT